MFLFCSTAKKSCLSVLTRARCAAKWICMGRPGLRDNVGAQVDGPVQTAFQQTMDTPSLTKLDNTSFANLSNDYPFADISSKLKKPNFLKLTKHSKKKKKIQNNVLKSLSSNCFLFIFWFFLVCFFA